MYTHYCYLQSNGTKSIIMITLLTQTAIAVLNDIADPFSPNRSKQFTIGSEEFSKLLLKLESGNIICRKSPECPPQALASYKLTRPKDSITLLDVLEATGEHLNCNRPTSEELYNRFCKVAPRLGVLNQVTRIYLSQIKLTDF